MAKKRKRRGGHIPTPVLVNRLERLAMVVKKRTGTKGVWKLVKK
jgi:hypothetical protein